MFVPRSWCLDASSFDIFARSVKILKHSARLFFVVMVGLNINALLMALALMFCSFLVLVSDRLPWWYPWCMGFSLGEIRSILFFASFAHSSEFMQFFSLSFLHGLH